MTTVQEKKLVCNKSKKLTDCEKRAIVALINANKRRSEIAQLFQVDPTAIDKIRSGKDNNPRYLDEKWDDLSSEKQDELLSEIEQGIRTLTGVSNGWSVAISTLREALNNRKKQLALYKDDDIECLKKVVKSAKECLIVKCGVHTDRIIMAAVLEALGNAEKKPAENSDRHKQ